MSFFTVAFGEVSLVVRENASSCCTSAGPGCATARTAWDTDAKYTRTFLFLFLADKKLK